MKTFTLEPTKNKDVDRVVDRKGNWETYLHKPSGTYLDGVTTILDRGYPKGKGFEIYLANTTPEKRDQVLTAAGEKGSMVHRAIETVLSYNSTSKKSKGKLVISRDMEFHDRETGGERPLTDEEWDCMLSFGNFISRHKPTLIASEQTVYSLEYGYAGTFDFIVILNVDCGVRTCGCKDVIGKIGLWDAKTSSGIRPSYSAQEAAYAYADNIRDFLPKEKEIEYIATLRLGTNHKTTGGYQTETRIGDYPMLRSLNRFVAARDIAREEYEPFDPTSIVDIPDAISFEVEHYKAPKVKKAPSKVKKAPPLRIVTVSECCDAPMINGGTQCENCGSDGKIKRRSAVEINAEVKERSLDV